MGEPCLAAFSNAPFAVNGLEGQEEERRENRAVRVGDPAHKVGPTRDFFRRELEDGVVVTDQVAHHLHHTLSLQWGPGEEGGGERYLALPIRLVVGGCVGRRGECCVVGVDSEEGVGEDHGEVLDRHLIRVTQLRDELHVAQELSQSAVVDPWQALTQLPRVRLHLQGRSES